MQFGKEVKLPEKKTKSLKKQYRMKNIIKIIVTYKRLN